MKPEAKAPGKPSMEPFLKLGIPAEWVMPLHELGYDSVDKIKAPIIRMGLLSLGCH